PRGARRGVPDRGARLAAPAGRALAAALPARAVGLPLGLASALRPDTPLDLGARSFGLLGLSLPNFWLGTLFVLLFARYLRWMPNTGGYVGLGQDPAANLRFLVFPA